MVSEKKPWHSMSLDDVWTSVDSNIEGLTSTEASVRFEKFGANELPKEKEVPAWLLLLLQFRSPLMYLMAVAVTVSFFISSFTETIFILVVMTINALVGFYQEYKANESFKSLSRFIKLQARIVRGGMEKKVSVSEIVPGDILILRPGDKVPADARIFESDSLKINEAVLTGESQAVEKSSEAVAVLADIANRYSMVFMGTTVEDGTAKAVVVETGINTQFGDIIRLLRETPEESTPLQHTIMTLSKVVGITITVIVLFMFVGGILNGKNVSDMFSVSLALFVSAIPEGLLPAITIVLTVGMHRILKHKGLVRRLAATEALGGVTIICTDKTGTLTEGKMKVDKILTANSEFTVDQFNKIKKHPSAFDALLAAALSSDAYIENPEEKDSKKLIVRGRSTEQAFVLAAAEVGMRKDVIERDYATLDTIFFSSDRKFSASIRETADGHKTLFAIGAIEKILDMVNSVAVDGGTSSINTIIGKELLEKANDLSAQGFRLVACAKRDIKAKGELKSANSYLKQLTLLGFMVLHDPLRKGVPTAFKETRKAGIKTVIVTGDNKLTAKAIASKIGISIADDQILEGKEIEAMSDKELLEKTKTILLYARVSPRHKLRLVQAFQAQGEVVAMFGDGANDVPALKAANIGVVVNSEVDAAREVADIVLLDSGFSTIVRSIEEGRIIFNNIKRVFLYLVTEDFSQFFIFFAAIALGLPLPLLAAQLLFVNLVESGLPDLALTTEDERQGVMSEAPRKSKEGIVNTKVLWWMIAVFSIAGLITMIFFVITYYLNGDLEKTRSMLTLMLCLKSLFLAFSLRSFNKTIFRSDIFANKWLTGAVAISLIMIVGAYTVPPIKSLLALTNLTLIDLLVILLVNILEIILIDRFKLLLLSNKQNHRSKSKTYNFKQLLTLS